MWCFVSYALLKFSKDHSASTMHQLAQCYTPQDLYLQYNRPQKTELSLPQQALRF
jgi:hypothetical protein